jgi:hypothetical protein
MPTGSIDIGHGATLMVCKLAGSGIGYWKKEGRELGATDEKPPSVKRRELSVLYHNVGTLTSIYAM